MKTSCSRYFSFFNKEHFRSLASTPVRTRRSPAVSRLHPRRRWWWVQPRRARSRSTPKSCEDLCYKPCTTLEIRTTLKMLRKTWKMFIFLSKLLSFWGCRPRPRYSSYYKLVVNVTNRSLIQFLYSRMTWPVIYSAKLSSRIFVKLVKKRLKN